MGDAHTAHHTQWRGKAGKVHFPGQCGSQIATTSDGSFRAKLEVRERERGRLSPGPWVSLSLVGRKSVWPREVRRAYRAHDGVCLETQAFPDQINMPSAEEVILRPGQVYRQITTWRAGVRA